jgi:hypothetical protein
MKHQQIATDLRHVLDEKRSGEDWFVGEVTLKYPFIR